MFKLLKNKFIAARLLAASFNNLGANIYNLVFVVYLAEVYGSKLLVGLADSIAYLPALLSIWLGFMADKTRKKTERLVQFSCLQGIIFLVVAYLVGMRHYGIVIVVAALNIFSDTISRYLEYLIQPFFKNSVPDEDLVATNSLFQVVGLTVVLSSQPLGVWLLEVTQNNYSLIAVLNALAFFLSALTYWKVKRHLSHRVVFSDTKKSVKEQLKNMYQVATQVFQRSDSLAFLPMIVLLLLGNILSTSFLTLMTIQLLDTPVLNFSYAQSITTMGIVQILGTLLGGLTIGYLFKDLKLITILAAQSMVLLLLGLSGTFQLHSLMMLMGLFCLSFLGARFGPIFSATLMRHVPDGQLGQVNAFISFLVTIAIPIGTVVFSFLGAYNLSLAWLVFFVLSITRIVLVYKVRS